MQYVNKNIYAPLWCAPPDNKSLDSTGSFTPLCPIATHLAKWYTPQFPTPCLANASSKCWPGRGKDIRKFGNCTPYCRPHLHTLPLTKLVQSSPVTLNPPTESQETTPQTNWHSWTRRRNSSMSLMEYCWRWWHWRQLYIDCRSWSACFGG